MAAGGAAAVADHRTHLGMGIGGTRRQAHPLQERNVEPIVAHIGEVSPLALHLCPQQVRGANLIVAAESEVDDFQLPRLAAVMGESSAEIQAISSPAFRAKAMPAASCV